MRSNFTNNVPYQTCEKELRQLLKDTVYSVVQNAFTKLCQFFPQNVRSYISDLQDVRGPHERVRIAVLEQLVLLGDKGARTELADLASSGWEFITRQNAINAIKRTGILTEQATENLINALLSTNNRLSSTASMVLLYFAEQPKLKEQIRNVVGKRALPPWQKDLVQAIIR